MQSVKGEHGNRGREGYWATHKYHRRAVIDLELESFCGWNILFEMIDAADSPDRYSPHEHPYCSERDKALVATTFLTGGRISEVVVTQKRMFTVDDEWILVEKMPLLKHWRKLPNGDTKRIPKTRDFIFPRAEPKDGNFALSDILIDWLQQTEDYLFPSPRSRLRHLSGSRAYQIICDLARRVDFDIWPHRLRSERASQLGNEYKWHSDQLMDFFDWESVKMARRYAHAGIEDMKTAYVV